MKALQLICLLLLAFNSTGQTTDRTKITKTINEKGVQITSTEFFGLHSASPMFILFGYDNEVDIMAITKVSENFIIRKGDSLGFLLVEGESFHLTCTDVFIKNEVQWASFEIKKENLLAFISSPIYSYYFATLEKGSTEFEPKRSIAEERMEIFKKFYLALP